MLPDAASYSTHRSLQIYDTLPFLSSTVKKMDWSQEEQDIVMDVGCGSGDSCRKIFLPAFPKLKKGITIDTLPEMINFAKEFNNDEKIEYHVADIEDKRSLEKWSSSISKIISIHTFHWLQDQETSFSNIYNLLKTGGEAAIIFVLTTPFWNSYEDLVNNPKWNDFLKNKNHYVPHSHYHDYKASFYKTLLMKIGFHVIQCEDEEKVYVFPNDDTCADQVYGIYSLTKNIPQMLKNSFKEEVLKAIVQYNGRYPDGRPVMRYTVLKLLLKKT